MVPVCVWVAFNYFYVPVSSYGSYATHLPVCYIISYFRPVSTSLLLTVFLFLCRCVLVREAGIGEWTRKLTAGMGIWICVILGIRDFVCITCVHDLCILREGTCMLFVYDDGLEPNDVCL